MAVTFMQAALSSPKEMVVSAEKAVEAGSRSRHASKLARAVRDMEIAHSLNRVKIEKT
jgi:hypothetical protein